MSNDPRSAAAPGPGGASRTDGSTGNSTSMCGSAVTRSCPRARLSLDTVARRSGLHPDLVRRFVGLGLVEATRDARGELRFAPTAPATLARIQRLRAGLPLNYASIGLVLDLLDRISRARGRVAAQQHQLEEG